MSPQPSDGSRDIVVIPSDKPSDLVAGKDDPRRYNVSALLRSGQTDASQADVSALDDKTYGQFTPIDPEEHKTAADKPVKTTVDGTKAIKVDTHVDAADLVTLHQDTEVYTAASQGVGKARGIVSLAAENSSVYAIPVEAGQDSSRKFTYRTTRAPKESTDSVYNLAFTETEGIPAELDYLIEADDLAAVKPSTVVNPKAT